MKKVKCMLDNKRYDSKPIGKEAGVIQKRLVDKEVEITIEELANELIKGKTFKPSVCGLGEADWIQSQLFALDFDHNTTIKAELNRIKELSILPCFGYTSFNHMIDKGDGNGIEERFRLVFCTDEVITDKSIAKQFQLTLMNIFSNCDPVCKNISKLYYGGRELIYNNYENTINCKDIIDKYRIVDDIVDKGRTTTPNISKENITNTIPIINLGVVVPIEKDEKTVVDNYYNIKAIRERNVQYLKDKLNMPKVVVTNNNEYMDYIKRIDLGELLEYNRPKSIKCLFHKDGSPSASIFQNNEGYWLYHCFVCGFTYNIVNVIERLSGFQRRKATHNFIREIFNIEFKESEWQVEQKEMLQENLDKLEGLEFEEICPTASKLIKNNFKYLLRLHKFAMDNVKNENLTDLEGNVAFFASTKQLCGIAEINIGSAKDIVKKNALFQYLNLLNKLADSEIPERMLARGQAIAINSGNKYQKHTNVYSFPLYSTEWLDLIETQAKAWKDNGYTMTACSREMFFRTEGASVSDKLYPQFTQVYDKEKQQVVDRTTSNISNQRTDEIVKILFDKLDLDNYCTESYLIEELSSSGDVKTGKKQAEKQVKKSIKEIMDNYGLIKIKCNKQIKEQYGIVENGYPFIITKEN